MADPKLEDILKNPAAFLNQFADVLAEAGVPEHVAKLKDSARDPWERLYSVMTIWLMGTRAQAAADALAEACSDKDRVVAGLAAIVLQKLRPQPAAVGQILTSEEFSAVILKANQRPDHSMADSLIDCLLETHGANMNPKDRARFLNLKGDCLRRLKRGSLAVRAYDEAIKLDPDQADAWAGKAIMLDNLGNFKEALPCWDRVLQLQPDRPNAKENRENSRKRASTGSSAPSTPAQTQKTTASTNPPPKKPWWKFW